MPAGFLSDYRDLSVEEKLALADNVVTAYATNAAFSAGLDDVAESPAAMAAIIADLDAVATTARQADDDQAEAYVDERTASALLKAAMLAAEEAYEDVYDRAEAAGDQDPALAAALDFTPKERNRAQRLAQMRQFLEAAEAHQAALAAYGVTAARLAAANAARDDAEAKSQAYALRDIEAQNAMASRNVLMGAVDVLIRDLQKRGRIAFKDQPQLLEILGLRPIP